MGTLFSELGAHVARLADAPRVYADANIPNGVVEYMRTRLRWDVLFVLEHDELRRAPDIEHYRLARRLGRTLVTLDRDYIDDRRFPPAESAGLIVLAVSAVALLLAPGYQSWFWVWYLLAAALLVVGGVIGHRRSVRRREWMSRERQRRGLRPPVDARLFRAVAGETERRRRRDVLGAGPQRGTGDATSVVGPGPSPEE